MTRSDFDRWWADLISRFPNVDAWLMRVAPETTAQRTMLRTWADVLADVPLTDALEVNRQMQSGDAEYVADFHEQDLPKHVRRLARQLSWDRRKRTDDDCELDRRPSEFPAGKILRHIIEARDRGVPLAEAKAQALSLFPIKPPRWEPRYNCHLCLDVGRVLVASPTAIRAMLKGDFDRCHHRECVVKCKCREHLPCNPNRPLAVYDAKLCFKIQDSLWNAAEVQRFEAWVEEQRERSATARAQANPRYEQAFAEWNAR